MFTKKGRYVALAAAAALSVSGLVAMAPAQAASKTLVLWTDEQRGPAMTKLLAALPPKITGYTVQVKSFSSLEALDKAWTASTPATGPDMVISNSAYATQGAKNGKLMPINLPAAVRKSFSKDSQLALSYEGILYGVPLDMDTIGLFYNKALAKSAPKTLGEMVNLYKSKKTSAGLSGGLCMIPGFPWPMLSLMTAMGGGIWYFKADGTPNVKKTYFNSPTMKSSVKTYLLGADGKTNGFLKWDGCDAAFKAGKIPYAVTGGWDIAGMKTALGSKLAITSMPGLKAGTYGRPFAGYQGLYVTTYASRHGVQAGAMQFANKYMASAAAQAKLSAIGGRPAANKGAAGVITDKLVKGLIESGSHGILQVDIYLGNGAGGSNYWDLIGDVFDKMLNKGADVSATLDAGAKVLLKDWAAVK